MAKKNIINWYEPQGKPWTLNSEASPGELNHIFLSAEAECKGGLNLIFATKET